MTVPPFNLSERQLPSDEEVMARVAGGDRNAFSILVERHQQAAWQVAFRYTRDSQLARDAVQEAFLKAFRARLSYRPSARFRTWFTRILVNTCLDETRRKVPEPRLDLEPTDPRTEHDLLERRQQAERVRNAIDDLPQRQKMAVLLKHFEGLSHEEVAAAINATPKAVERLLAKARERLSRLLT